MTPALDGAVELLERALGYTRVVLADVTPHHLDHPTPCSEWDLDALLAHMEDALDAFTEAAGGVVGVDCQDGAAGPAAALAASRAVTRVGVLQTKACVLLGAWSHDRPVGVRVGGLDLDSRLLVATAALEVAVHGWDVGQATGRRPRIPEALARSLLPVAREVIDPADRGVRFAPARPTARGAGHDARLLALLGRDPAGT